MKISYFLVAALPLIALLTFPSCGVPVCIAGIGDCSAIFAKYENQPAPSATATPSSTLSISGPTSISLATNPTNTFSASGGSGVYFYSVSPYACGSFNTSYVGRFTASIAGPCTVTVTDTSSPVRTGTYTVTVTQ